MIYKSFQKRSENSVVLEQLHRREATEPTNFAPFESNAVRVDARRSVPDETKGGKNHPGAFQALPLRSLPWGLSCKGAPGVWLFDDDPLDFDNVAHQGLRFDEFLGDVVTELAKKNLQSATVWRSHLAGSPVVFIEQNIGVMRRLWCVVEFERVAGGSNVGVRVRRMVPRNLDVFDWTLTRPLIGFPFLMIRTFVAMLPNKEGHDPKEFEELEKHPSSMVCLILLGVPMFLAILWWVLLLVLAVVSSVGGGSRSDDWKPIVSFFSRNAPTLLTVTEHANVIVAYVSLVVSLSFFIYMFVEAKKPWPNDLKKSQMLYHAVRDAIGRAKLSAAAHFGW